MHVRSIAPLLLVAVAALTACSSDGGPNGPPSVTGAIAISAGQNGSCAIGASGGLACWGAVPDGSALDTALGSGVDVLGAAPIDVPVTLIAVALQRTVDGGGNNGCFIGSDRKTYCWGTLMDGETTPHSLGVGFVPLAGATSASSVALDRAAICVTRTDNKVRCFGSFFGGGRGSDSVDVSDAGPGFSLVASGLSPVQSVIGTGLGYQFGCALRTDSLVACWGTRHRGQLAGAVSDSTQDCSQWAPEWCRRGPAPIAGGHKYRQLSAQFDHACATRIDGGVDCWGRKFDAATTGNWLTTCATGADCQDTPTAVAVPGTVLRVSVGYEHACALVSNGDIYCWGDNSRGQLGRPGASSATPVKVNGGIAFQTLSAGQMHTCGIETGSGAIGCWGANESGQLGDGTTEDSDHPVPVVAAQ
jgi:hypothetical protein